MAQLLFRLGRYSYNHALRIIALWLMILAAVGIGASQLSKPITDSFSIPGIESVQTQEKMSEVFGTGDLTNAPTGTIVFHSLDGKPLSDQEHMTEMNSLITELKNTGLLEDSDALYDPVTTAAGMSQQMTAAKSAQGYTEEQIASDLAAVSPLSSDSMTGTISITVQTQEDGTVSDDVREELTSIIEASNTDDLQVSYSGNGLIKAVEETGSSEIIGLFVAAIVLIITFGSLIAAGMPLITAVVGVAISLLGISLATYFTDSISSTTSTLSSMIGLAVGIDYALFIASRFRNEIIEKYDAHHLTPKELTALIKNTSKEERAHIMGLAVGKAGSAVIFAGLTVFIALIALTLVGIPFLSSMAIAAACTVVVAVLIAISLLPAIMSLLGVHVFGANWFGVKAPDPRNPQPTMGTRWSRFIRKYPKVIALLGIVVLGIIAIPTAQLRLAMPTDGNANLGSPQRVSYDLISDAFGPGRNAPMIALVDTTSLDEQDRTTTIATALQDISAVEGVANAQITNMTSDQSYAQILITPTTGATDEVTSETLTHLRDMSSTFHEETGAEYGITGVTPIFDDISSQLSSSLLPYVALVLVLAFIILMVVFQSIWVPLIATLGFGLSVAAAFGATVAIFQLGWFGIIEDPQPLVSFMPIILIGLIFGLAMDYEVFLVSRMREEYSHGHTAHHATEMGVKYGARVVTAAAIIMMSVFFAFIGMDAQLVKTMGFGLGIAVLFDAFIVRMTIIPATMYLLGDKAWKLPRWLKLPKVDIEGASLSR